MSVLPRALNHRDFTLLLSRKLEFAPSAAPSRNTLLLAPPDLRGAPRRQAVGRVTASYLISQLLLDRLPPCTFTVVFVDSQTTPPARICAVSLSLFFFSQLHLLRVRVSGRLFFSLASISIPGARCIRCCSSLWLTSRTRRLACSPCATICRQWAAFPAPLHIICLSAAVRSLPRSARPGPPTESYCCMSSPIPRRQDCCRLRRRRRRRRPVTAYTFTLHNQRPSLTGSST